MLTLAHRPPRIEALLWETVIRLCRRARQQAATRRSRRRQLDALSRLDDRLLADIGLTREQQMSACSNQFWWLW